MYDIHLKLTNLNLDPNPIMYYLTVNLRPFGSRSILKKIVLTIHHSIELQQYQTKKETQQK